jgi:hypothetical protein
VQVFEHDDRLAQRVQQLADCAEDPVPLGAPVAQWLGRFREARGQLGQQRAERADDGRQAAPGESSLAECLDDRTEREGLAKLLAGADIRRASAQLLVAEELLDQPRLADPGLAFDDREGGRARRRLEQELELALAPDQNRCAQALERPSAIDGWRPPSARAVARPALEDTPGHYLAASARRAVQHPCQVASACRR